MIIPISDELADYLLDEHFSDFIYEQLMKSIDGLFEEKMHGEPSGDVVGFLSVHRKVEE